MNITIVSTCLWGALRAALGVEGCWVMMMRVENTNCHSSDSWMPAWPMLMEITSRILGMLYPCWRILLSIQGCGPRMRAHRPSRGARGACFPLLKAFLLLRGSSFLLKVKSHRGVR